MDKSYCLYMTELWPDLPRVGKPCSVSWGPCALVWWISRQKGSWGQKSTPLPAALLEDPLVITGKTKPDYSFEVPSSSVIELHLNMPQSSPTPQPRQSHHSPSLAQFDLLWDWNLVRRGFVAGTSQVTQAPAGPFFRSNCQPSPGTRWPFLSLWTHSLYRVKLHLKLTQ
jgi:hypothetical protein